MDRQIGHLIFKFRNTDPRLLLSRDALESNNAVSFQGHGFVLETNQTIEVEVGAEVEKLRLSWS